MSSSKSQNKANPKKLSNSPKTGVSPLGAKPKNNRSRVTVKKEVIHKTEAHRAPGMGDKRGDHKIHSVKEHKKRFPITPYCGGVLDPESIPPSPIPDEQVDDVAMFTLHSPFTLKVVPIVRTTPAKKGLSVTTTVEGYGAFILLGGFWSTYGSEFGLRGCIPPISQTSADDVKFGMMNGDAQIDADNLFGEGTNMDFGPCSDFDGMIDTWRINSASVSVTNNGPELSRAGTVVMWATPGGSTPETYPSSGVLFEKLGAQFPNTRTANLVTDSPYAVWFPSTRRSRTFTIPSDDFVDNGDQYFNNGMVGIFVHYPLAYNAEGILIPPSGQDINVLVTVNMEAKPQTAKFNFLPTSKSWANSRSMDNAYNVFVSQSQLHINSNHSMTPKFDARALKGRLVSKRTGTKRSNEVLHSVLEPRATSLSGANTTGGVSGTLNNIWDTVSPVLNTITKYTPTVLSVLSDLGV